MLFRSTTDPSVLGFAKADVNTTTRSFNIVNNGDSAITVNSVSASNGFSTDFSSAKEIAAGSKLAVKVSYIDSQVQTGIIPITNNSSETLKISLQVYEEVSEPTEPIEPVHTHKLGQKHAEVPATCTKSGTKDYYDCLDPDCSVKLDKDGNEITDITIPALGHTAVIDEADRKSVV